MLKKLILLFAIPGLFIAGGCGNTKKKAGDIPGMLPYDLIALGAPITIYVPDTTKTKLEASALSSGTILIKSGKDFQISINPGEGDFALIKSDIASDEVKKFKRYVTDEPNSLIWEAQVSGLDSEFHFYTVVKAGKDSYIVEDVKEGDALSEKAIMKMVEAAKSIKAKETVN